jgi:hypothetical protein
MNCPKCNHEQKAESIECEKCGVIFAKYNSSLNSKLVDIKPSFSIGDLFFYTKIETNKIYFYGRLLVFIGLIFWGFKFITSPIEKNYASESFMHLINLPFHEAGHIFFRPFGSFMASLGGTLGQFIMPFICFIVLLLKTRDTFGSSVTLWWFGQNFFDIAPYINDARALKLPLLGGNVGHSSPYGFHDWEYLLKESGLIQHDHFIANLFLTIGTVVLLTSFVWGGILLLKQYKGLAVKS